MKSAPFRKLLGNRSTYSAADVLAIIYDAVESAVAGIIVSDLTGRIVYANQRAVDLLDFDDVHELRAYRAGDFFGDERYATLADLYASLDWNAVEAVEFRLKRRNGETLFVDISCSVVRDSDGREVGRMMSFMDISRRKALAAERERLIDELKEALDKIETLRGLLPICAWCKKIRDDDGYWEQVENYVEKHSSAKFSHGICPECVEAYFPQYADALQKDDKSQA